MNNMQEKERGAAGIIKETELGQEVVCANLALPLCPEIACVSDDVTPGTARVDSDEVDSKTIITVARQAVYNVLSTTRDKSVSKVEPQDTSSDCLEPGKSLRAAAKPLTGLGAAPLARLLHRRSSRPRLLLEPSGGLGRRLL
ncbi:hypothetical protein PF005_g8944 [Phytophthora fragariae]|uniref:Uncharacterized protein n=1 Tax=Phytophthora fragariae TaxID=53985 RepID=A0A6A4DDG7_9STRA|nr:hypothetical protein PF009_g9920 [Phytophthora fragariae]KAE9118142.1 hypothetical protein PF007_g9032 [Phytophthora fragariae]KAE9208978.1 hypothetical protein PF004_g16607 [Phytophthora fragariae]KAE9216713.1 hypothetical protein PF005_g8944 [Phytophthora fragariae]KAE9306479.1 hypothetical protein PF001_g12100 [Phytophthora fragariae]